MTNHQSSSSPLPSVSHTSLTSYHDCHYNFKAIDEERLETIQGSKVATLVALSLKLPQIHNVGCEPYKV